MSSNGARSAFVRVAEDVAAKLGETAVARDRAGNPPFEEVELLRQSGLLKLLVPEEDGGLGGAWPDALQVTRIVAAADGSIGQLIGYHYVNSLTPTLVGTPEQGRKYRRDLATNNWFVADSVNPLDPRLEVRRDGERFILNGVKSFSTGAQVADNTIIAFPYEGKSLITAVPRGAKGFVPNDDWDNIGQRLTASGSVSFDQFEVLAGDLFGDPLGSNAAPSPRATIFIPLAQSVFVHFYLGIAEGALNAAAKYTREHSKAWFKSGVTAATDDALVLTQYGELAAELGASLALAMQTAHQIQAALDKGEALTADERAFVAVEVFKAKVHSTRTALAVTSKIFEVTGARATASKFGFDRYWRNVRTHTVHDPVVYKAREIGEYVLLNRFPEFTFYS